MISAVLYDFGYSSMCKGFHKVSLTSVLLRRYLGKATEAMRIKVETVGSLSVYVWQTKSVYSARLLAVDTLKQGEREPMKADHL